MFKTIKPFAAISLALAASFANATDIGFGGLSAKTSSSSYEENSYLMTPTLADDLIGYKTGAGKAMETSAFTFTAVGGGTFDLKSFDLDYFDAKNVKLTYTVEGQASQTMKLTGSGSYTLGLDDLVSFSLAGKSGGSAAEFLVDDIRVKADTVAAVPEPSSMALMFAGVGLFATVARRRRA